MNDENGEFQETLSQKLVEMREINIGILRELTSIQAALTALVTVNSEEDPHLLEVYRSQYSSVRDAIAAAMRDLALLHSLEDFLTACGTEPQPVDLATVFGTHQKAA